MEEAVGGAGGATHQWLMVQQINQTVVQEQPQALLATPISKAGGGGGGSTPESPGVKELVERRWCSRRQQVLTNGYRACI